MNGYAPGDELPDYRRLGRMPVLGTASGPFGSGVNNLPIPMTIIKPEHWDELFDVQLEGGIAGYEPLARPPAT